MSSIKLQDRFYRPYLRESPPRRKSMSFATGAGGIAVMGGGVSGKREDVMAVDVMAMATVEGEGGGARFSGYPSPPSSLPTANGAGFAGFGTPVGALPAAESMLVDVGYEADAGRMGRGRRASEGAHFHLGGRTGAGGGDGGGGDVAGGVIRTGRARSGSELKCDKCGKGYKHSSCLTKHLWEHTPEWSYTSKLLISKHQQVQLLEAASILVSMNPTTTPPASISGASINGGNSSTNDSSSGSEDTTPPPSSSSGFSFASDITSPLPTPRGIRNGSGKPGRRYSTSYSRSYQPSPALAGSAPSSTAFPSHFSHRPTRSRAGSAVGNIRSTMMTSPAIRPTLVTSAEDEALAAAVELLSCSFNTGTPVMGPTAMLEGVPRGGIAGLSSPPVAGRPGFLGPPLNDVVEMKREEGEDGDVRMDDLEERRNGIIDEGEEEDEDELGEEEEGDEEEEDEEDEEGWKGRGGSEEEDNGVFGQMEE